jgi:hypothetical protein
MTNLEKLSIDTRFIIAASNDKQNLQLLCAEILSAPILKEYRPKIYEMAERMDQKIKNKNEVIKQERSKLTPCCNLHPIFCQCNAD